MYKYLLIALLFCAACSGETEISGKWKLTAIDYSEFEQSIPEMKREAFRISLQEHSETIINKTFFTFSENQKLVLQSPDFEGGIDIINGKYRFSENNDSLFLELDTPESYVIIEKSDRSMKLKSTDEPLRTLTLEAIN